MSNRRNIQFTYNPHNKLTVLDCNFIVDSANGNGFGVRSLDKGGRIASVFMATSQTPGKAADGLVNPNPASGVICVALQDNYNDYRFGTAGWVVPLSGTPISISGSSVLTRGAAYVIVSLGSSTQANWVTAGLSPFIKAAVGVSFIASGTGGFTGTGQVEAQKSTGAGITDIEVLGDANLMNNIQGGSTLGFGVGMQLILLCYNGTTLTAPADGTVIGLSFFLNDSAQGV